MTYEESIYMDRIIELEQIDQLDEKYVKHLFLYDLSPLLMFRPSNWRNGFILRLVDSDYDNMLYEHKVIIDEFFLEMMLELIARNQIEYYYSDPMKLIDKIIYYMAEVQNIVFCSMEDDMTDAESIAEIESIIRNYLDMFSHRFHLLTDSIFRKQILIDKLFFERWDDEFDYGVFIKRIIIESSGDRSLARLFVYEIVRRDIC